MSLPLGTEGREAIEAIHACDRLLSQLVDRLADHERAAAVARPDWDGPHRDAFEDRFSAAQYKLRSGEWWVLQLRRTLEGALAAAVAEAREAATAASRSAGPR